MPSSDPTRSLGASALQTLAPAASEKTVNSSQIVPAIAVAVVLFILFVISRRRKARAPVIAVPQAAASARESMHTVRKIMVPTAGTDYSERAVELACRMGEAQGATIYLLHVMVVPRSQPLATPQPQEETKARAALSRAESIVHSHGLTCETRVERARSAGEGIIKRAKEIAPDVIVVGMRPNYDPAASLQDRTSHALLREAPCEVIFDKMPTPVQE